MIESFPLHWPTGFPRTQYRKRARFGANASGAYKQLRAELRLLGATNIIVSTNVPLKQDGTPYAEFTRKAIPDPGAAVYFTMKGQQRAMASDRWDRVDDNIRALSLTIAALRGMDRWGTSEIMDRIFRGFVALPAPSDGSGDPWWETLKIPRDAPVSDAEDAFRRLAKIFHPDRGGSVDTMAKLNRAIEAARLEKANAR